MKRLIEPITRPSRLRTHSLRDSASPMSKQNMCTGERENALAGDPHELG